MLPFCSSSGDFAASVNVKELPQPSTSVGQTQRVFFKLKVGLSERFSKFIWVFLFLSFSHDSNLALPLSGQRVYISRVEE